MRYKVTQSASYFSGPPVWVFQPVDALDDGDYGSYPKHADAMQAATVLARNNGQWSEGMLRPRH